MILSLDLLPEEIIFQHNLKDIARDGYVYLEIWKGIYGITHVGMLSNNVAVHVRRTYGYSSTAHTPGLWRHQTSPIYFTLVLENFGVKYVGLQHAEHLVAALADLYPLNTDREGKLYCDLTLNWDYNALTVDITMTGYTPEALNKFQHPTSQHQNNLPHY